MSPTSAHYEKPATKSPFLRAQDEQMQTGSIELTPLVAARTSPESQTTFCSTTAMLSDPEQTFAGTRQSSRTSKCISVITRICLDTWIAETVACIFSIACITAIASILYVYDDRPIPRFPSGVTLNTIVSILSTSARSAIISTASTCVGQLKWCWYKRSEKSLNDAQTMDDASRGLSGAIRMLVSGTGGYLAAFGGVITLLLVAFGPLIQQLLEYPTRDHTFVTNDAAILQNLNFTVDIYSSVQMRSALMAGMYTDKGTFQHTPRCPTAHCHWENYRTVEWCSKCEDMTALAKLGDCDYDSHAKDMIQDPTRSNSQFCNVTLGKGLPKSLMILGKMIPADEGIPANPFLSLQYLDEVIWYISGLSDFKFGESYLGIASPLLVMGYVRLNSTLYLNDTAGQLQLKDYRIAKATQCALTLCERKYNVQMNSGEPFWNRLSTDYGRFFYEDDNTNSMYPAYDRLRWHYDAENSTQGTDQGDGHLDQNQGPFRIAENSDWQIASRLEANSTWAPDSWPTGPTASNDDLIGHLVIKNLTNRLESIASSLTDYGLGQTNTTFPGSAISQEVYVHVRWRWIILPVVLQVFTILLFVLTVFHSHRVGAPVWKSSLLPIWYHTTEKSYSQDNADSAACQRLSDMGTLAHATAVRLSKDDSNGDHLFKRASREDEIGEGVMLLRRPKSLQASICSG
jgi:hypothetical protein